MICSWWNLLYSPTPAGKGASDVSPNSLLKLIHV